MPNWRSESIRKLACEQVTIFLTTQYLEEADRLADRIARLPRPLMLLPFPESGFVPAEGMPSGLAWIAEHQPLTPIMDTLRGLLYGTPIGNEWIVAVAWCVSLGLVGYFWSKSLYNREPTTA